MRKPIKFESVLWISDYITDSLKRDVWDTEYRIEKIKRLQRLNRFWAKAEADPVRYSRFWQLRDPNRWGPSAYEDQWDVDSDY